jgi:hypothetical protein
MTKTYKAKKGRSKYILIGTLLLPVFIFFLDKDMFSARSFILLPLLLPVILSLWMYFGTSYKINGRKFIYRNGISLGKIEIEDIKEIVKKNTLWNAAALAKGGFIIKYNRHDMIYIAPEDNDELISDLLKINNKISVTG